ASDLPILRNFTRVGYRDLLRAGVRVFEYEGPMIHAKTMLVDRRWARVGSSNLNVSSLLTNYELDLAAECEALTGELANQFRRDLASSREIVLQARRLKLPPRLVGAPAQSEPAGDAPHKRSGYELGAVAVVALRRVAGGLRRAIAATAALGCAVLGGLLLVFPRIMGIVLAAGAFTLALAFGVYALERRRTREPLDIGLTAGGARPDATAERRALNERLRQALAELPERRRMAVVLFDVEGYSHGEIALILGIPEGTVRSEVFHARRRLRVLLADWKEEG